MRLALQREAWDRLLLGAAAAGAAGAAAGGQDGGGGGAAGAQQDKGSGGAGPPAPHRMLLRHYQEKKRAGAFDSAWERVQAGEQRWKGVGGRVRCAWRAGVEYSCRTVRTQRAYEL